jgi:hypothetical protein
VSEWTAIGWLMVGPVVKSFEDDGEHTCCTPLGILKVEAAYSSKISGPSYQNLQCYNTEDHNIKL